MDYLRVLRRRWYLVVAVALVCVGASVVAVDRSTEMYRTSVQFVFVDSQDRVLDAITGQQTAEGRAGTYVSLARSGEVLGAALQEVREAGVGVGAVEVNPSQVSGTVFLNVDVSADSAQGAYQVAQAYTTVLPRYVERFERQGAGSGNDTRLQTFQAPGLPSEPYSPNKERTYLLGLALGLVLGLAAAFVAEGLDRSVRTVEEVERVSGLNLLASIPVEHRGTAAIAATMPRSQRAEAIRQLRTNVQFAGVDKPLRTLAVTSAVSGEGKTTTAANLAITSALAGQRVLLVDADLRRPGVAAELGLEGSIGLTNLLIDETTLADTVQPWGPGGELHVLPSGPIPANPSELLGSLRMLDLIHELKGAYDLVVFDTPPVLPVTDATVLGRALDGVVFVTKMGSTRRDRLKRAVETVRKLDLRVVGVACNWTAPVGDYYLPEANKRTRGRRPLGGLHLSRRRRSRITAQPLQPAARRRQSSDVR
nr:polysaccharide biosynthesis tyrosine autokinase [Motilibacter aurantiacus]